MITKLACAALVTFALTGAAAAAEDGIVLHFDASLAATPEGRADMLSSIGRTAREACARTGTRVRDHACEETFTMSAIRSVQRADLREALLGDYAARNATEMAEAGSD